MKDTALDILFRLFRTIFLSATGVFILIGCCAGQSERKVKSDSDLLVGAARTDRYLSMLKGRRIALVANPTSRIGERHLVDTLISAGVDIDVVFAPEHGFRGEAGAGEKVAGGKDARTGVRIISLYGKRKQPGREDLKNIDVVVFDIQDVGVRFYTYISTLQYVMEACALYGKELIVLDRPNPLGYLVDGPVLDTAFRSFVGMNPIPVIHGCTVGEYAKMIYGEKWLRVKKPLKLTVVEVKGYTHSDLYQLPVKPSPNLPNMNAIYLYPSLCFFEGTPVSIGRGTSFPFETAGFPEFPDTSFSFRPRSLEGVAMHPPQEDTVCYGWDLRSRYNPPLHVPEKLELGWLLDAYRLYPQKNRFFQPFFNKLAGNDQLRSLIVDGADEKTIRKSWEKDIERYRKIRNRYLLYPLN